MGLNVRFNTLNQLEEKVEDIVLLLDATIDFLKRTLVVAGIKINN